MKKIICILIFVLHFNSEAQKSVYNFKKIDSLGFLLDSTLTKLNKSHFNKLFLKDKFFYRVIDVNENDELSIFQKNLKYGFESSFDYGEEIVSTFTKKDGSYRYLHFYLDDNNKFHLLFRILSDNGLNYHDILLNHQKGEYYIQDIYNYYTGENLSKSYREIYQNLMFKSINQKNEFKYLDALQIYKLSSALFAKKEYKKAYKLLKKTPVEFINQKKFQLLNVEISANLKEKLYTKAIKEYERNFKNDFSVEFLKLDYYYYYYLKDHTKALEQINKLDKKVDGDVFLEYSRANVYIALSDFDKAITSLNNLISFYPTYLEAYNSLLLCYIKQKKYTEFILLMEVYITQFKFTKTELIKFINTEYPILKKEAIYQEWLQKHN